MQWMMQKTNKFKEKLEYLKVLRLLFWGIIEFLKLIWKVNSVFKRDLQIAEFKNRLKKQNLIKCH